MPATVDKHANEPRLVHLKHLDFRVTDLLSSLDISILCVATVLVMLVLLSTACSGGKGLSEFFLVNRKLSAVPMLCGLSMSNLGSLHFRGLAGEASRSGLAVYAYVLNSAVALILLGWFFLPVYIASGSLTTIDYLKKRYGGMRIELYLACLSIMLIIFTKASVEVFSAGELMATIFPELDRWSVSLPVLFLSILLASSGGLRTVVYTQVLLAFYLLMGGAIISYYCVTSFQDFSSLREAYLQAWPNTTRTHFGTNSSYPYTNCGIPKASAWNLVRPYYDLELPWPGMIFGVTVLNLWDWCCDQVVVQIGIGAKSLGQAKSACIISGYVRLLSVLFLVMPGLVARVLRTDTIGCADPDICQEVCQSRSGCSDLAFPSIFLDVVGAYRRGLAVAAVLACSVASVSASLNSGGAIFTINIYHHLRSDASEMELLLASKIAVLMLGLFSLYWAGAVGSAPVLYSYVQSLTSDLVPPMVAVFVCGMLWSKVNEAAAFQALMLGFILGLTKALWSPLHGSEVCGEESLFKPPGMIGNLHFLHFAIFLFALCVSYMVLVSIFAEPTSVVHLYRLTYWLRHSKLDRVDLNEFNVAYEGIKDGTFHPGQDVPKKPEAPLARTPKNAQAENLSVNQRLVKWLCCVQPARAQRTMTPHELRELVKHRVSIAEARGQAASLNLQGMILLLVVAALYGFLA